MNCEIEYMDEKLDSCRKTCKYSMWTCCALVPVSIVCIVVGHLPLLAVLAGHGCLSAIGGPGYQLYSAKKQNRDLTKLDYQEIAVGQSLRKLSTKITHDDVMRTILVNPDLHNKYNHCINYITRETKNDDRIKSIRIAIDRFSLTVHEFYYIKPTLLVYEVCEDMIMNVVYRDVFQYCLTYTKKDDTTYINNYGKPIPDIPESIQNSLYLEEYALQLNQIIDHTSSRDKVRVITNVIKRAPKNSSADDIIVFLCVVLQKSRITTPYAEYYFMKAFLNIDPHFCQKGKTAYCLNLWYTAIAYLSRQTD